MSEIATLELLEPYLAQVAPASPAAPKVASKAATAPAARADKSGNAGSQLEIFFSEVRYSTFVRREKVEAKPRLSRSSNSASGSLKYSLRLH